jgi:hypothetical protein
LLVHNTAEPRGVVLIDRYRNSRATKLAWPVNRWLAVGVVLATLVACSTGGGTQPASGPVTRAMAHERFTVHLSADVINLEQQQHVDIVASMQRALDRIDQLLPGPSTLLPHLIDRTPAPGAGAGSSDRRQVLGGPGCDLGA